VTTNPEHPPARGKRTLRLAMVLAAVLALNAVGAWLGHLVNFQLFPRHEPMLHLLVMAAIAVYVLLMATPFMPGIEIGLAVMALLGPKSAALVYLCTVLALSLSYAVGRFVPLRLVCRFLGWLYLERASGLVRQLEPLGRRERLAVLNAKAPRRVAPFLLRHRYLTIAALLNLPGNALLGGGGGIGLVVGMSGLVPYPAYLLVVAVAVAPVPLLVYFQP